MLVRRHICIRRWLTNFGTIQSETAEQAKHAVQSARFPPLGRRSFPPFAVLPGVNDAAPNGKTVFDVFNDNAAVIMQIESALGVQNAAEIAAVPGGR
jgi:2-keto-3-deoxy-L-rhamnonate aldolase RhmA